MDLDAALDFARTRKRGVLVTVGSKGRPQLSNIAYSIDPDHLIRISITASRVKYRNLLREPWAALHIANDDFYRWVVLEGDVTLSEIAAAPDDAAVNELIEMYRAVSGEHPDWDEYRAAMVADQRVAVRLAPNRAYGTLSG
jgi:PPOX class probable F420-dependent enzyme